MKKLVGSILLHTGLILISLVTLLPFVWMLAASLMPSGEANLYPPRLLPSQPTLEHYHTLFNRLDLVRYFVNSLFLSSIITLISVFVNAMAGYAFAKLNFHKREFIFNSLLATLVIPGQITMLPLFLMLKSFGFINSYFGVIIPGIASVFGIFLIRQYMQSLPNSLLDAARIDGANEWQIYWSIVLPLARPILITLAIFTFMGTWNDFMWPLIVLSDSDLHTLPVALANLVGEHVDDTELMMAGAVMTVLPVLVVFIALQRFYLQGIMAGSVKG